jgi:hypothetical protein
MRALCSAYATLIGRIPKPAGRVGVRVRTSAIGPERRKTMSAPMSAMGLLSGLVVLTLSSSAFDPERKSDVSTALAPDVHVGSGDTKLSLCQTLARFQDVRRVVWLIEKQAARNASTAVARVPGRVKDGNVGTRRAKSLRDIPAAARAVQAYVGEYSIDRHIRIAHGDSLLGVLSFQDDAAAILQMSRDALPHEELVLDDEDNQ